MTIKIVLGEGISQPTVFEDIGCNASPSCLACPLPQCLEDLVLTPGARVRAETKSRDVTKVQDFKTALQTMNRLAAARFVAKKHGVTIRTGHRILLRNS